MNNLKIKRILSGKIDGVIEDFSSNLSYKTSYRKGEKSGLSIVEDMKTKIILQTMTWKKGERHGAQVNYDNKTGLLSSVIPYRKDEKQGIGIYYNEDNIIKSEVVFEKGKRISSIDYDIENNRILKTEYKKNGKEIIIYDEDENLLSKIDVTKSNAKTTSGHSYGGELKSCIDFYKDGSYKKIYTTNSVGFTQEALYVDLYTEYYKNGNKKIERFWKLQPLDKTGRTTNKLISEKKYDKKGKEIKLKKKKMTTKELKDATSRINKLRDSLDTVDIKEVIKNIKGK